MDMSQNLIVRFDTDCNKREHKSVILNFIIKVSDDETVHQFLAFSTLNSVTHEVQAIK